MKFRRQHSIGSYVVDFYCPECRLAVELDGEGHFSSVKAEYDARRTAFLSKLNVHVIRFENRMVFENLEGLLQTIRRISADRSKLGGQGKDLPPPNPLLK
jgi:very-short-patch-repair endonuclease